MPGSTPASLIAEGPEVFSVPAPPPASLRRQAWRRFSRHTLALISLFILGAIVFGVVFGGFLWPVSISDIDVTAMLQGPSLAHPFGTNELGQDILARMIFGGRISLAVGVAAMAVTVGIGVTIGAIAGMASGRVDAFLMWVTDLFLALPQLPLLLLLMYLFGDALRAALGAGGGTFLLIVTVIGGLRWMSLARLVRAQFLSLREKEFVEAARALGASRTRLMFKHLLPNALGPVIVAATIEVANAIIFASTLSFLGLGFPPDVPTWGRMLYDAQDYLDSAPYWALMPGSAIFLSVLSINFIGDGLRDALDPRRVI
jgi:peptide/nickel transport system permease protein